MGDLRGSTSTPWRIVSSVWNAWTTWRRDESSPLPKRLATILVHVAPGKSKGMTNGVFGSVTIASSMKFTTVNSLCWLSKSGIVETCIKDFDSHPGLRQRQVQPVASIPRLGVTRCAVEHAVRSVRGAG